MLDDNALTRHTAGSVQFSFSMVSGKEIIKHFGGDDTPAKPASQEVHDRRLDFNIRLLGHESGNADKMLQYSLFQYIGEKLENERRLFIPQDSKINNS